MADKKNGYSVRFKGEEHWVTKEDILAAAAKESPRSIKTYFVEIDGRRYPPKQLVRAATGTKQFFDTAAAARVLRALGLTVISEPTN
jgi:5-methylcytosine-specific restriction protein B